MAQLAKKHGIKMLNLSRLTHCMVTTISKPCWQFSGSNIAKNTSYEGLRLCHFSSVSAKIPATPLFVRAVEYKNKTALVDKHATYSYQDLLKLSCKTVDKMLECIGRERDSTEDLKGKRVAVLCPNDASYVISMWAVWMLNGVMVPLAKSHPPTEWKYFIEDSDSTLVMTTDEYAKQIKQVVGHANMVTLSKSDLQECQENIPDAAKNNPLGIEEHSWNRVMEQKKQAMKNTFADQNAIIIYTSGTTGRPKGVVHTFGSLDSQMMDMIEAWEWSEKDAVLHVLPLHHIHGLVNVLMTPLSCGATCVMLPKFEPGQVWSCLQHKVIPGLTMGINIFMAVPQIYKQLIEYYNYHVDNDKEKEDIKESCTSNIRLMVSGSSALPEPTMCEWREITGHTLLERYGMTELGMVLTNPLDGDRVPGAVGSPFPSVQVMVAEEDETSANGYTPFSVGDSKHTEVFPGCENKQGILYVKGGNVFKNYWHNPKETKKCFTKDGWFITGDTVEFKNGAYRILGRPVDIIKSRSYKISALDIEARLLEHDSIKEAVVFGLPKEGDESVVAVLRLNFSLSNMSYQDIADWAKERMPYYWVPEIIVTLEDIPKNAMGKVNKKELRKQLFPNYFVQV